MVRVMGGTLLCQQDTGLLGRVFWDQAHTTIVRRQIYAGEGRASRSIAQAMESFREPWPKQDLPLDPTSKCGYLGFLVTILDPLVPLIFLPRMPWPHK